MVFMHEEVCVLRGNQSSAIEGEINLAGTGMADVRVKKAGGTPGHGVEEQQVHNERWAGALRLMGRFIISHYQLIPLDRLGPVGMHQGYVKERLNRGREPD